MFVQYLAIVLIASSLVSARPNQPDVSFFIVHKVSLIFYLRVFDIVLYTHVNVVKKAILGNNSSFINRQNVN